MNNKLLMFACLLQFVCNVIGRWAIDDDGCITPFSGSGSCVDIFNCQPIKTFLRNATKPISNVTADLLREYHCGYQSNIVKVCCPRDPSEMSKLEMSDSSGTTGRNSELIPSIPDPPYVSSHENLHLLPEECGYVDIKNKIMNGNKTGLFEFPWMALLSYKLPWGPEFRCGGTVINDRYILTAAHCVTDLKYPLLGVRVGEHDLRTRPDCETVKNKTICAPAVQDIGIGRTIPHPQYNRTSLSNDIGLIRLASKINFVENVAPVCLPVTQETATYNFTGREVTITGFGVTETRKNSPTLLKVEIPYIELNECRKVYLNSISVGYRQLCAGGKNGQDSCEGDSGGPLLVVAALFEDARYVQQGITSFGPRDCGANGKPGVYTKVAYYMDWILDSISN